MTAEQFLTDLETKAKVATHGARHTVETDDGMCMNAVYIATTPEDAAPGEKPENVIAVTLLQSPPVACIADAKWDENAALIAATNPETILRLISMTRWLAKHFGGQCPPETLRFVDCGEVRDGENYPCARCRLEAAYMAAE